MYMYFFFCLDTKEKEPKKKRSRAGAYGATSSPLFADGAITRFARFFFKSMCGCFTDLLYLFALCFSLYGILLLLF